jgi:hypothetical protein
VALAAALSPAAAEAPDARLRETLRRAAVYVAEYRERLALLCASERLEQSVWTRSTRVDRARTTSSTASTTRVLVSDVVWVPSDDALVVAFYRDVLSVDGAPVRDRGARLLRLFPQGPSAAGREKAGEILLESARHNLGEVKRTTNFPTLALGFLHALNQPRFAFHDKGTASIGGRRALHVAYREEQHPTLTASQFGEQLEAEGGLWVALDDGAVLKTELRYPKAATNVDVFYAPDQRLGFWVPQRMLETYGDVGSERFEGVAKYTSYRRGEVEIGPIR